jgi:nucleoid-associated protein YgaU
MGRTAKIGLFLLMGLVVALARLVEVSLGKARAPSEPVPLAIPFTPPSAHPKLVPHAVHRTHVASTASAAANQRAAASPVANQRAAASAAAKVAPAPPKPQAAPPAPPVAKAPESVGVEWPKGPIYTVKRGETPGEIAQKLLGSAKLWPRLAAANGGRLANPNAVRAGTRLVVPPREAGAPQDDK